MAYQTLLSKQEIQWLKERRVTRLTDNKEVQIYPMGAERYLSTTLFTQQKDRYTICQDILEKDILVIPGYGNTCFLFAEAGAKSLTVYDKDPVTIAWMKAFKKYYHYKEEQRYPSIGELFHALTAWYPPLINLPKGNFGNYFLWALRPNALRRVYIHYILHLVNQAIQSKTQQNFELEKNIQFHTGTLDTLLKQHKTAVFDTAFVPYLLGVTNGIEEEKEIVEFMQQLLQLVPQGHILINPSRNTREFHMLGKHYFVTTNYADIQSIPGLKPYFIKEDKYWFRTQGLAIFGQINQ